MTAIQPIIVTRSEARASSQTRRTHRRDQVNHGLTGLVIAAFRAE